jgi:hypothetical protein
MHINPGKNVLPILRFLIIIPMIKKASNGRSLETLKLKNHWKSKVCHLIRILQILVWNFLCFESSGLSRPICTAIALALLNEDMMLFFRKRDKDGLDKRIRSSLSLISRRSRAHCWKTLEVLGQLRQDKPLVL